MTRPLDNVRATAILATAALLAGACGGARARPTALPADAACTVAPAPTTAAESASVVSLWAIDPANASMPSNPGERFAFAHAYETLIRVDCLGRLVPGLARSWAPVDGGARWRLVLRDSARFWNGDALTATDVVASWGGGGTGSAAKAIDERTLEVDCGAGGNREPGTGNGSCALPAALGDPEMAVMRRSPQSRWAEGTGPYRIRDAAPPGTAGASPARASLLLEPVTGAGPKLTIHSVGASDARDLIDAGVDLLLTEDPALASYAAARPELTTMPLAWDRTWALLTPTRNASGPGAAIPPDTVAARTLAFRSALARDAVRATARAAEAPYWWSDATRCERPTAPERTQRAGRTSSRIAFQRDEPVARALAERLVALAAIGTSRGPDTSLALLAPGLLEAGARATAVALAPNDFATALRSGSELAFVVSLPRRSLAPCRDVERLMAAAPWPATITPLVDTRLHAVVRRDRLGVTMQWDSTLTISTPAPNRDGARP